MRGSETIVLPRPVALFLIGWARMKIWPFKSATRFDRGWMLFTRTETYYLGPGE